MNKKEHEIIVDPEFIKERDKVLDKQVKFLKSKGYEMAESYFDWCRDIGKDGRFVLYIDLSLIKDSEKYFVYCDVPVKTTNDIKVIQRALQKVKQDYLEVMKIGENENETERHD